MTCQEVNTDGRIERQLTRTRQVNPRSNHGQNQPGRRERVLLESDARAVVQLLGDAAVHEGDRQARRRFMLAGLARIVDADVWAWAHLSRQDHTWVAQAPVDIGHQDLNNRFLMPAGVTESEVVRCLGDQLGRQNKRPGPLTYSRRYEMPDKLLLDHDAYQPDTSPLGVNDFVYSIRPLDDGAMVMMAFYRMSQEQPFTDNDCFIVHLLATGVRILKEVSGLDGGVRNGSTRISDRLIEVLGLLLSGHSKKQVAYQMGLSFHTVDDYMRQLYLRYHVSSRRQLLSKFVGGEMTPPKARGIR